MVDCLSSLSGRRDKIHGKSGIYTSRQQVPTLAARLDRQECREISTKLVFSQQISGERGRVLVG